MAPLKASTKLSISWWSSAGPSSRRAPQLFHGVGHDVFEQLRLVVPNQQVAIDADLQVQGISRVVKRQPSHAHVTIDLGAQIPFLLLQLLNPPRPVFQDCLHAAPLPQQRADDRIFFQHLSVLSQRSPGASRLTSCHTQNGDKILEHR